MLQNICKGTNANIKFCNKINCYKIFNDKYLDNNVRNTLFNALSMKKCDKTYKIRWTMCPLSKIHKILPLTTMTNLCLSISIKLVVACFN